MRRHKLLIFMLLSLVVSTTALEGQVVYGQFLGVGEERVLQVVRVNEEDAGVIAELADVDEARDLALTPDGYYAALWYSRDGDDWIRIISLREETVVSHEDFPGADPHWTDLRELCYRRDCGLWRWSGRDEPELVAERVGAGCILVEHKMLYYNKLEIADWVFYRRMLDDEGGDGFEEPLIGAAEPFLQPELVGERLLLSGPRGLWAWEAGTAEFVKILEFEDLRPRCPTAEWEGAGIAYLLAGEGAVFLLTAEDEDAVLFETPTPPTVLDWGPIPPPPPLSGYEVR
ncbi:MAG: hypothetical protein GF399_03040 [Candidatus Coatesbacteria bacterium]|nr:hypothetical protein [Candidatus Coatesbacteria bacterium]